MNGTFGPRVQAFLSLISDVKRDSITILADILKALNLSKPTRKMSLVYKANLNFERIKRYLDLLLTAGLVEMTVSADHVVSYRITNKGREFLIGYECLVDSLKASTEH